MGEREKRDERQGEDIDINRENVNEVYRHILDTDARIVVCYGGRDSGKSYFVGGQYIPSLLCSQDYFRGVAVRKVFATHRDSCYQEVVDGLDMLEEQEIEKSTLPSDSGLTPSLRKGRHEEGTEKTTPQPSADGSPHYKGEPKVVDEKLVNSTLPSDCGLTPSLRKGRHEEEDTPPKIFYRNISTSPARGGMSCKGTAQEGTVDEELEKSTLPSDCDLTPSLRKGRHEEEDTPPKIFYRNISTSPARGGMSCKGTAEEKKAKDSIKTIKSPLEINHKNGNKLIFRGLDKPKKLKSLKGLNFIWVEEAEDLTREEFYELLMLLRGAGKQQIVLTFNPVDEGHFTNGMFVESLSDEVMETFDNGDKKVWIKYLDVTVEGKEHRIKTLCLRTTYEDNAYISVERKAAIEQLAKTDPYMYEVYRLGKFGTRGGRILYNIEEVDFKAKGINFIDYDNRGYAQDFGFNHANCILAVAERDNNLYVFEELYGSERDTAEWIEAADKRGYDRRLMMVCDSVEPDRIKTWVRAGYRAVAVKKYPGSVNGQIDRLKRYNRIYINSECVNTLREAREWKWKQDKRGRFVDVPEGVNDDAMAALRYSSDLFGEKSECSGMRTVSARMRK